MNIILRLLRGDDAVDAYSDVIINSAVTSGSGRAVRRVSAADWGQISATGDGQFVAREVPAVQRVLWAT